MTPLEHQQIAEVNAQWRNMNTPKDIEAVKNAAHLKWLADWGLDEPSTLETFRAGWDAAVAYLSEPGAMRFFANESVTKENEALKKRVAELEQELGSRLKIFEAKSQEAK